MLCISPMVGIWGAPHAPMTGRCRYSGECPNPNQKDASCLGGPKPHISDGVYLGVAQAPRMFMGNTPCPQYRDASYSGCRTHQKTQAVWESPTPISPMACIWELPKPRGCLWGVPHAPKTGRCRYSGECPNPNQKDASCLGVPKPHISDGVYLGVAQAPRRLWGVPHAPKSGRCRYSGECPNPNQKDASCLGSPQAPYLRWYVFGSCPSPKGVYGEYPMPPD